MAELKLLQQAVYLLHLASGKECNVFKERFLMESQSVILLKLYSGNGVVRRTIRVCQATSHRQNHSALPINGGSLVDPNPTFDSVSQRTSPLVNFNRMLTMNGVS